MTKKVKRFEECINKIRDGKSDGIHRPPCTFEEVAEYMLNDLASHIEVLYAENKELKERIEKLECHSFSLNDAIIPSKKYRKRLKEASESSERLEKYYRNKLKKQSK